MFAPDIVGLGMDSVDVALLREQMPRWEDPGITKGFTLANGGVAGTACAVAAMFGVSTGFIDTLGNDEMTAFRLNALRQAGVDVSRMVNRGGPETRISIVFVKEESDLLVGYDILCRRHSMCQGLDKVMLRISAPQ